MAQYGLQLHVHERVTEDPTMRFYATIPGLQFRSEYILVYLIGNGCEPSQAIDQLIQRMIGRQMVINETAVTVPRFSLSNEPFTLVRQ